MSWRFAVLKNLFLLATRREIRKFEKALLDPAASQALALKNILRECGLQSMSPAEFLEKFPLRGEEQLADLAGLTVVTFETTSGSSGHAKQIPYTKALLESFQHAFRLWSADILKTTALRQGRFFFSVSPQNKEGAIQEDSDYLNTALRWIFKPFWAVDASGLRKQNPSQFMQNLAFRLLQARDLEVISIWSPSYLFSIMDIIEAEKQRWSLDANLPLPTRAALVREKINWLEVWPGLKFISAWGSAAAETGFAKLRDFFPGVKFQSKGLLATEAPMTIPWGAAGGCVPLLDRVFFEFVDPQGQIFLLNQLTVDQTYEVLISTPGQLKRYRIGDLVQVTGFYHSTPTLEFVGRAGDVCDLTGEKLSELAVRTALRGLDLGFYVLIPDAAGSGYHLFSEKSATEVAEARLKDIFHYDVSVRQGQLRALRLHMRPTLRQDYLRWLEGQNQRRGDIKERALIANLSRATDFLEFLDTADQPGLPSFQQNAP